MKHEALISAGTMIKYTIYIDGTRARYAETTVSLCNIKVSNPPDGTMPRICQMPVSICDKMFV